MSARITTIEEFKRQLDALIADALNEGHDINDVETELTLTAQAIHSGEYAEA